MESYGSDPWSGKSYQSTRNPRMESASVTLGLIALLSCNIPLVAFVCGALAIVFASLSRGGRMSYTSRAQAGLILGSAALSLMALLCIAVFFMVLLDSSGMGEYLQTLLEQQGVDYDAWMQMFTQ